MRRLTLLEKFYCSHIHNIQIKLVIQSKRTITCQSTEGWLLTVFHSCCLHCSTGQWQLRENQLLTFLSFCQMTHSIHQSGMHLYICYTEWGRNCSALVKIIVGNNVNLQVIKRCSFVLRTITKKGRKTDTEDSNTPGARRRYYIVI